MNDTQKRVLFVCVHNAGRSQMAEAFVNALARERGLPVRGLSAGTQAGSRINPLAEQVMAELGISLEGQEPKQLTDEMAKSADRTITMGCGVEATSCPAGIYITEDWGLDEIAGYFFHWSAGAPDVPGGMHVGPDWYPATDAQNFSSMAHAGAAKGFLLGAYMAFNVLPPTAPPPVYDASHIARDDTLSAVIAMTASAPIQASRGVAATLAPASTSASARAAVRL